MSDNTMTLQQYQDETLETAVYPGAGEGSLDAIVYTTLGLAGEAGEIPNKVKKIIRDFGGSITDTTREAISKEIGDVLWYVARLADELGFNLGDIADKNLEKLSSRVERGVLGGSGDDR